MAIHAGPTEGSVLTEAPLQVQWKIRDFLVPSSVNMKVAVNR